MSRRSRFGGTRLRALLGAQAVALVLGAALPAAGANAEAIEPHVVTPVLVTPHEAAPDPESSPRLPGSASSPTTGGAPAPDNAPPVYIGCSKDKYYCGPLTPEELKEVEEARAAVQAMKRRKEEEELRKQAELREKYLADHPPTVIDLYIGQFLCPLFSRGWTILVRDEDYTERGGLLPSPELKAAKELFDQLRRSYSCITAVAP